MPKNYEWITFDLDDKLHHFKKASSKVMLDIYKHLEALHSVDINTAMQKYQEILSQCTRDAFTSGMNSYYYRSERMRLLIKNLNLGTNETLVAKLVNIYKDSLLNYLELVHGAKNTLTEISNRDYSIAVVTEGPQDAQEWTIRKLGIDCYINRLITSNAEKQSKKNGLFSTVLKKLNVSADKVMHIGDSLYSDVIPAQQAGIQVLWYNPKNENVAENSDAITHSIQFLIESLQYMD